MDSYESDLKRLEAEVRGTTLRVYWEFFKGGGYGVREIQRRLRLSSPSVALYHLEKLRRLGLLDKDNYGQYVLADGVKIGVMRSFIKFGRLVFPRYLFYAIFFWAALSTYIAESILWGLSLDATLTVVTLCAASASTYEAVRAWRDRLI
ncbi:hypothetical protein KEJ51_05430 [Candidatus Bathyarchaeota archaeon]|nr:hypothetical protein [Candidatus Bathyarchaeota archaeon]